MRLLVITQKVDTKDSNLGFFTKWISEFSKQCEHVTVICLEKGSYDAPSNVKVFSLGKEAFKKKNEKGGFLRRVHYSLRFVKLILSERKQYDGVFVHMNTEYVLLGWFVWRILRKRVTLWYVHKQVNLKLRLAEKLVEKIFTASEESCRLDSTKIEIVGHGIPVERSHQPIHTEPLHLVTVGRISPVKDVRTLLVGFSHIQKSIPVAECTVIGEPITDKDRNYALELRKEFPRAHFVGRRLQDSIYADHPYTAFIHASQTGSIDKAVLEALFAGLPVFTSSEAFGTDIPGITKFEAGNPSDLAEKIERAFREGALVIGEVGRVYVEENHSLSKLIPRIVHTYGGH
ncbi:MAG: hypothetical protein COV91_01055 [Candidatus Taylorbacteria bacterium CG11_big_fil_rev_8_21_14_0_20_46_11]|uniref:Glycosyl transferase family 1 domain-containing protein n=1 Tax=Candidatus Taylorbacteria bacterium CG11_big_fil_rev_8_21_14_0_20_46_11 TaxID=1975025 RepID=A0A2H0KEN5_9BACT|nr:MAG: hypothetical protein COV91_01055 [Candidatus Taylorbacteria bacterium CG11_big_fil_rev_8_21_14_0_20_46_11]